MAYSEQLATRIRKHFAKLPDVEEKQMMGGMCIMYKGKMCVGIFKNALMCRVDPTTVEKLTSEKECSVMEMNGRKMKSYVIVEEEVIRHDSDLAWFIQLALDFNPRAKASKK